jgi:hypothetical protein
MKTAQDFRPHVPQYHGVFHDFCWFTGISSTQFSFRAGRLSLFLKSDNGCRTLAPDFATPHIEADINSRFPGLFEQDGSALGWRREWKTTMLCVVDGRHAASEQYCTEF